MKHSFGLRETAVGLCLLTFTFAGRADEGKSSTPLPSLFLSCPSGCSDSYLRQELSYFNFSRDSYQADIALVIVRQPAGSGGERFTVALVRRIPAHISTPTMPAGFTVPAGTPEAASREILLQVILRMLHSDLQGTEHAAMFELRLPKRNEAALGALSDPWDYWVFAPELRSEGEGGSGYYFGEGTAALTIRRVTELNKLRLRGSYTRHWSGYLLEDGSRVSGDIGGWDTRALYARSLFRRWALGGVAAARGSEFENLKGHVHGGPLAEFNLFPYVENASQQIRVAYQLGAWANWYIEANTAGLLQEVRPYHALSLIIDLNQSWGSVQWMGQANQFVDESRSFRLSTGAGLGVRLFEGFSVGLDGEAALVRDQINLRRRPVSDEELLLWTVEQPTGYTFQASFVVAYTFGSIHNTIVNPRFARVDLDEE